MNDTQKVFISILKEKIPFNISAIDEIASVLGVNYDAAYRRLTGKVAINLEESILLAKKFDISLNDLFKVGEANTYLIRESSTVKSIDDINIYLKKLFKELSYLVDREDDSILYNTRDLPMFYFFNNPLLIHFKVFIWFSILKADPLEKRTIFDNFKISDEIVLNALKIGGIYNRINVTEMWSYGAINNVLQQLIYFHKMRQISLENVVNICNALTQEIKKIENKTINGGRLGHRNYELYSNDLLMMNNSIILKSKDKIVFAYPYALLKYFRIENQKTCKLQENYILEQMQHATCISKASTREHTTFFNLKYDKIKQVLAVIKNEETKPVFL